MPEQEKHNDYDSEPVFYCAVCLSLKIKHEDAIDSDCCGECGSTNIAEATLDEWEKQYEKKYGHKYAEKTNDIRNSPYYKMPFNKLMEKVSNSPRWEAIIREIYSSVPKGVSKIDSIVLFFGKLVDDNKLDKLKELLYKWKI